MNLFTYLENRLTKITIWDIGLIKIAVMLFTLWLIAFFPKFTLWVQSINHWYFLGLFVLVIIRPFYNFYLKK